MKHTVSKQLLADFEGSHQTILPFDSITFEFTPDMRFLGCEATKTVQVDALADCDYDKLNDLLKLAVAELEAKQLADDLKGVNVPEGLTTPQVKAIIRKFKQSPDGSANLGHFMNRVSVGRDYAAINWCGMYLGIELDGYTHS